MKSPEVTDFVTVVRMGVDEFHLRVKLDSRWVTVGKHKTHEEALLSLAALNQALIEYHTKKNTWENNEVPYCKECRVEFHDVCSMTPGCPCCDDTIERNRNHDRR